MKRALGKFVQQIEDRDVNIQSKNEPIRRHSHRGKTSDLLDA